MTIVDFERGGGQIAITVEHGGGRHLLQFGSLAELIEFGRRRDHGDEMGRELAAFIREVRKGDANLANAAALRGKTATVAEIVTVQ